MLPVGMTMYVIAFSTYCLCAFIYSFYIPAEPNTFLQYCEILGLLLTTFALLGILMMMFFYILAVKNVVISEVIQKMKKKLTFKIEWK